MPNKNKKRDEGRQWAIVQDLQLYSLVTPGRGSAGWKQCWDLGQWKGLWKGQWNEKATRGL